MKTKVFKIMVISFILMIAMSSITSIAEESNLISHWTFDTDGTNSVSEAGDFVIPATGVEFETIDGHKGISITRGSVIYHHNWGVNIGGSFTIAMYLKSSEFTGFEILLAKGRKDESCHFEVYLESGYLCLYAPSLGDFKSGIKVNDGTMHHIAITFNGQNMTFYVDGENLKSIEQAGAIADGVAEAIMVGLLVEQQFGFEGFIDDVRIYNKPLNESEIKVLAGVEEPATQPTTQPSTEPSPQTDVSILPLVLSALTVSGSLVVFKRRKI